MIKRHDHRRNRRTYAREELAGSEAVAEIEAVLNDRAILLHEERVATVNHKRFMDRLDRETRQITEDLEAMSVLALDDMAGSYYDEGDLSVPLPQVPDEEYFSDAAEDDFMLWESGFFDRP